MSIGIKLGILSELDAAAAAGGYDDTRLVGLGNQTAGNSDYWRMGSAQHNSNVRKYSKYGAGTQGLQAFMCTFYLDALDQDVILLEKTRSSTGTHKLTIKTDGSIVLQLDPRTCGNITWTTAAGTIEIEKNYMIVAQCSAFNSSILSNTSMYLGTGGTITNLTSGMSDGNGIANPGGGGYANAVGNYESGYEGGKLSQDIVGSISAMHFWNGGVLTEAGITALYNGGTPLTDPSSDSGDYSATMAGYYYDGGDFTGLSAGAIANSYEFNDFASPANFNYLAGSGGPEVTVKTSGNGFIVIHP